MSSFSIDSLTVAGQTSQEPIQQGLLANTMPGKIAREHPKPSLATYLYELLIGCSDRLGFDPPINYAGRQWMFNTCWQSGVGDEDIHVLYADNSVWHLTACLEKAS